MLNPIGTGSHPFIDLDMTTIELIRQEVERRMASCDANSKEPNQLLWAELGALLSFLDTLVEKEVDLEEEIEDFWAHLSEEGSTFEMIEETARHFYELGKNAK